MILSGIKPATFRPVAECLNQVVVLVVVVVVVAVVVNDECTDVIGVQGDLNYIRISAAAATKPHLSHQTLLVKHTLMIITRG